MQARGWSVGREGASPSDFSSGRGSSHLTGPGRPLPVTDSSRRKPHPGRGNGTEKGRLGHSGATSPARMRYLVHLGGTEQVSGLQEGEDVQ